MSGDSKKSSYKAIYLGLALGLISLAVFARLLPHPPNFAPIAAVALFSGAYLPKRWAVIVPLMALILSDLILGLHSTVLWTWGSFGLIALASARWLRGRDGFSALGAASLSASFGFYVISNFGVWLQGGLYPLTSSGLAQSYIMGLPFLRATIVGDLVYTGALFGLYALGLQAAQKLRLANSR